MEHGIVNAAALLFVVAIIFLATWRRRGQDAARKEVQLALLSKFSTATEMERFLATEEGRRFVDQLAAPSNGDPRLRAVRLVSFGIASAVLSIGLYLLQSRSGDNEGYLFLSVVFGALAIGFLSGALLLKRILGSLGSERRDH